MPQRVLVVSGSPDELNTNAGLRDYVVEGFRECKSGGLDALGVSYPLALQAVEQWRPQLVVVFGSVMLDTSDFSPLSEACRRLGAPLVFWVHDDPYEFDMNERIYPYAAAIFTNDRASLDHYPPSIPSFHLPLGVSPLAHRRSVTERSSPGLFFCGHAFANRQRFFGHLVGRANGRGSAIQIFGSGWNTRELPQALNQRLPNSALPDFYASAIAVANVGRDLNLSNRRYAIKPSTPGPRTFEAAAAGAAQIILTDGLEIVEYFEPGSEVLVAHDEDQFFDHWMRLMREPSRSVAIGRSAMTRALGEHTYARRASQLLGSMAAS